MSAHSNVPIIIKRKKVVRAAPHHGGAWKVAYADFVTAMMAFFMLMWLLNATTEKQRRGIADYFAPTVPVAKVSGGGNGMFGGDSVFTEETLAQSGTGASSRVITENGASRGRSGLLEGEGESDATGADPLEELAMTLLGKGGESMISENAARHVVTRLTDEGLIVEVFDLPDSMLFEGNSAEPLPVMQEITSIIAETFATVENGVAINGHVSARPLVIASNPVWDLSHARATVARELVEKQGLETARMKRVSGHADRNPIADNPMAARNNRLEFILLRSDQ